MKSFLTKNEILLSVIVFCLFWIGIFSLVIYPMTSKMISNAEEIESQRVQEELNKEKVLKIPEIEDKMKAFNNEKANIEMILEPEKEIDFINSLEAIAAETGNKLTLKVDDKIQTLKQKDGAAEDTGDTAKTDILSNLPYNNFFTMEMTIEGRYDSFLNFLNELENLNVSVNMVSLNVAKNTNLAGISSPEAMANNQNQPAVQGGETLKSILNLVIYVRNKS